MHISNEELALLIQNGDNGAVPLLWKKYAAKYEKIATLQPCKTLYV
jgi:hypothetical protein